jgi:hypothetical protein
MVDDRPDDVMETGRPKRPPSTLELSATEVPHSGASTADESNVPPDDSREASAPRRGGVAAATFAGALAGGLVAGLAWFAGSTWLTSTPDPQPTTQPQVSAARIDDVSARLAKLESRPLPVAAPAPTADLTAITARLDALDKAAASLRDDSAALRAQSSQALTAATDAQKDVKATPRVAAPDLSGITGRLTQVEAATRAQADKIAEQARKPVDEMTTRRIATASLLDAQVRTGEPYAVALAAAKTLAPDAAKLTPLEASAATGVPSANALARALLDLPELAPPPSSGTSGGLIDRLKSGATKLVKIERTDSPNTDNAIFTRAADAARRDDIATAARELAALPPPQRAAIQPWLDKVANRDAAQAASRLFANDALAAMPKPQATQ